MREKPTAKKPLLIALVCITIGVVISIAVQRNPIEQQPSPTSCSKTIHYRFRIRNTSNRPVSDGYFLVRAPVKHTGTQDCKNIESVHPYSILSDSSSNQILKFSFDTIAPYASKIITVKALVTMTDTPAVPAGAVPLSGSDPPQEMMINDPGILRLARELTADSVRATAFNIYEWVANNIAYAGYSTDAKGAANTFVSRKGDCTEFADLFVALAQAADIPARRVSGYLARQSGFVKPADYHDWAEFSDKGVWRIADAQLRNFDEQYADYIAMRIVDHQPSDDLMMRFHRFSIHGKGLEVKMDS